MTKTICTLAAAMFAIAAAAVTDNVHAAEPALAFFVDPSWKTSSASVAVDADGGKHVAFYYYEPNVEQRPTHAVYAYCASQCDKAESWKSVGFAQAVRERGLELTPAGKPRLLITAESTAFIGGKDYYCASCDAYCTQESAWTLTNFASGKTPAIGLDNDDELPRHDFALDPQGRPRFVYRDENQAVTPNHFGLFYVACDAQCDQKAQWRETLITTVTWEPRFTIERVYHPGLAFSLDGKPRVVSAEFFPINDGEASLAYLACENRGPASTNYPSRWRARKSTTSHNSIFRITRQNADGNLQFRGQVDLCAAQRVRGSGRDRDIANACIDMKPEVDATE